MTQYLLARSTATMPFPFGSEQTRQAWTGVSA